MSFNNEINAIYDVLQEMSPSRTLELMPQQILHIEEGSSDGIVLKSDTSIELGGPFAGSLTMVLQTTNERLVNSDNITLIGNDIHDMSNETVTSIPFGQIILVSGDTLGDEDYLEIANVHNMNGYFEGYMVKSNDNNLWVRMSKTLVQKGFNFTHYGNAIIEIIKKRTPAVQHAEIIFITSTKEDLTLFSSIAEEVQKKHQVIKENKWLSKGINIYDCAFHGNCSGCNEKNTCNEIKQIAKKIKEINK